VGLSSQFEHDLHLIMNSRVCRPIHVWQCNKGHTCK